MSSVCSREPCAAAPRLLLPLLLFLMLAVSSTFQSVPLPCVFPFIYQQKSYSSCTGINSEKLWCATTANYDVSPQWKYCSSVEYGGNSGGQACVFPFSYKSQTFYTCTNEDAAQGRFWCATTGSYDKDEQWSYCADTRLSSSPTGPCIFPFTYKGNSYSSCTTDGTRDGKPWCSLTKNYDVDPKWTYCDPSEPLPCIFPFIFQGKSYSACTKEGAAENQLWCAVTADYDKDSKWKACASQEYEGNSKGRPCVFPFIYKSRTFYTCTNENSDGGRFWCATTGNYDKDTQWSYCADTRLSSSPTGPCIFPFTYKSKSYSSCTTDGTRDGKPWCSLTKNYDVDPKWTYCDPSEPLPCIFPFIFQGKSYSACTKEGAAENQLWCAVTADYDKDSKWKACASQEYEGNSKGRPCVFPFIYKSRTFYTCTNENSDGGRFWCATTGNYDKDTQWSYCADTRLSSSPTGPCIFPFTYKSKSYSSCTTDGTRDGKPWCSLTKNYDVDPKWTYCDPSEPLPCIFPFIFQGKSYSACTKEGAAENQLWCAVTADYDKDSKWKACASQEYEGNSKGRPCVFPFIYKSRTFYTCTNENSDGGRFWCATTGNYDKDTQWSYCADTRLSSSPTGPCIFPFTYKSKSYSSCTTDGSSDEKPWCSLTKNYDVDPKWTYCNPSGDSNKTDEDYGCL